MAKFVILGVEGESGVWLVDFEAGTVNPVSPVTVEAAGAADAGFLEVALKARTQGYGLFKGIDLAVATQTRSDASAQHMSTDPNP